MPVVFWVVIASVSVTGAIIVALQPGHLLDLQEVRGWLRYWLVAHDNPYEIFWPTLDYPPIAFLMLWPISLPPDATLAYWYLPCALALAVLAGYAQLRWISERMQIPLSVGERVAFVALMLSGDGVRGAIWRGQTMALSLLLGALAMQWKRRRPFLAAVCLALCSFKPHIAAGFGVAILLIEGATIPFLAVAIALGLSWAFAATVGESLLGIGMDYISNLLALYGGPDRVRGMLSIRFVLDDLVGWYAGSTAIYVILAVGSLVAVAVLARRRRRDPVTQVHVAVASMLGSLLFLPHQLYDSLFAAPALCLLMWPESGLIKSRSIRAAATGAYVMFGVLSVPRVFLFISQWHSESDWLFWISHDLSPLRVAALFLLILWGLYRRPPASTGPVAEGVAGLAPTCR